MNIRAEMPAVSGTVIPLPLGRSRKMSEGFLVPVSDTAAALFFDESPVETAISRQRLSLLANGDLIRGPLVSTSVALRSGGRRHVVLVGRSADWLLCRRVTLGFGPQAASVIDPDWLQSPLTDVAMLFDGLSEGGRQRLLKLFLTTGASLLGRGKGDFVRSAWRLLDLLGAHRVAPLTCCRLGAAARVISYRVPAGFEITDAGELVMLSDAALARVPGKPITVERLGNATLLHVFIDNARPKGSALVTTGALTLALALPDREARAIPLERWLRQRDATTRRWAESLLDATAASDVLAQAISRELRHAEAAPCDLAVDHLSATPAGILYAFRLSDPSDLVSEVRVTRGGGAANVAKAGETFGLLSGYLPLARCSNIDDRFRIALVYRSGRIANVAAGTPARFDGAIPAVLAACATPEIPTAIARARLDRERPAAAPHVATFGASRRPPRLSLVCPVGRNLDAIRTRAAMVFAEREWQAVEMIYHAPDDAMASAARSVIAHAAVAFGIPHRFVVLRPDLDGADRLLAGVRQVSAPRVLLLGADVLPSQTGWIAPWLRLGKHAPMHAGTVAGHDGPTQLTGTRRPQISADCFGFLAESVAPLLESASRYGAPDVLVAEVAEGQGRRQGHPVGTLATRRFVRYDECTQIAAEKAADAAALRLILKRSFNFGCDDVTS